MRVHPVLHIRHPRPTSWNSIIEAFSHELGLQVVPYPDWFAALEETQPALRDFSMSASAGSDSMIKRILEESPALRLMLFFRAGLAYRTDPELYEPPSIVIMDCNKLSSVSESFRATPGLSGENVKRWIAAWMKSGFF